MTLRDQTYTERSRVMRWAWDSEIWLEMWLNATDPEFVTVKVVVSSGGEKVRYIPLADLRAALADLAPEPAAVGSTE